MIEERTFFLSFSTSTYFRFVQVCFVIQVFFYFSFGDFIGIIEFSLLYLPYLMLMYNEKKSFFI